MDKSIQTEPATSPSTVLALDLGTKTGWALHGADQSITSGTVLFKNDRWQGGGMRFLRFKQWLTEVKQVAGGLDAIFFEEVHRHLGVDAAHAYGGFLAHVTAWCEHHQIPYEGVPVGTIKRHATGKGNANKEAMIAAMQSCGFSPGDDNEADALALLQWAREQRMDPVTIATKGAQPVLKGAYLWKFFHFAAVLRASATCCACCLLPRFAQPLQRPVIVSIFIN